MIDERMLFVEPPFHDGRVFEHVATHAPDSKYPINGLVLSQYRSSLVSIIQSFSPKTPMWIGGSLYPYTGPGTRYYEGMMDDVWRWDNILTQVGAANDMVMSHPNSLHVGWYVTEEGNITDWAANENLRLRYEWYYIELAKKLYEIKPLPFIFSPWVTGSPTEKKVTEVYARTFNAVKDWLKENHDIDADLRVHLQDGVGMGTQTREKAKRWALDFTEATPNIPVRMNVEYFTRDNVGAFWPGNTDEILNRESFYQRTPAVPIGACWEVRYWYPFKGYYSNHRD